MLESEGDKGERRREKRICFETRVYLKFDDQEIHARGTTHDLSQKGVFVATDASLSVGMNCLIEIYLSGASEPVCLSIKGRVARVVPEGVGLEFFEMDLESFTHLRNILLYNSEDTEP